MGGRGSSKKKETNNKMRATDKRRREQNERGLRSERKLVARVAFQTRTQFGGQGGGWVLPAPSVPGKVCRLYTSDTTKQKEEWT